MPSCVFFSAKENKARDVLYGKDSPQGPPNTRHNAMFSQKWVCSCTQNVHRCCWSHAHSAHAWHVPTTTTKTRWQKAEDDELDLDDPIVLRFLNKTQEEAFRKQRQSGDASQSAPDQPCFSGGQVRGSKNFNPSLTTKQTHEPSVHDL